MVANENKENAHKITGDIIGFMSRQGKHCSLLADTADCVIALGGDGTLLRAAAAHAHLDAPFLGINLGNLGFLAEVDRAHIEQGLTQLINGEYDIEERMMLSGRLDGAAKEDSALNDIVVAGQKSMQLIYFSLYVNGIKLTSYVADGMIISTPTGSTAYNLSAGGPIIEPRAQAILLTPICAHSLKSRSIVLSADDEVALEIEAGKGDSVQECVAIFDGHRRLELQTGERLSIKKAEKTTSIVRLSKTNFLERLKQKL